MGLPAISGLPRELKPRPPGSQRSLASNFPCSLVRSAYLTGGPGLRCAAVPLLVGVMGAHRLWMLLGMLDVVVLGAPFVRVLKLNRDVGDAEFVACHLA